MTIRVVVADDQALVRAGFRLLLSGEPDIDVVGEASDGLQAVEVVAQKNPDVVLMDIRMPNLDGLEASRRILASGGHTRVLILTTFDLDEYVYEALRLGASGFVLKDDPPEQLIAAIRVVAGDEACDRTIHQAPAHRAPARSGPAHRPRDGCPSSHRSRDVQLRDRLRAIHR